jgi:hypothetical protein
MSGINENQTTTAPTNPMGMLFSGRNERNACIRDIPRDILKKFHGRKIMAEGITVRNTSL